MKKNSFYSSLVFFTLVLFSCNSNTATTDAPVAVDSSAAPLVAEPVVAKPIKTIESFMIKDHEVLGEAKADLNKDGFQDVILVLKNKNEDELADNSEEDILRPLLILLGDASGSYELAVRNDNAVLCSQCGGQMGDAFEGLEAKDGEFALQFYGGAAERWARLVEFEYDKAQTTWLLKTDRSEYFQASNPKKGKVVDDKKQATPIKEFDVNAPSS